MIQTKNLTKQFPCSTVSARKGCAPEGGAADERMGWFTAVDHLNLEVPPGEILALLGPNGAGKTTTVRMLASILRPTQGWARVAGFDTVRDARQVRQSIGLLTEFPGLYLRMRADEYLAFFGRLQGMAEPEIRQQSAVLLERFGLAEVRHDRITQFSKGMRQKLALIRTMLHDPLLLLLDEPTSAMDPHSAKIVREAILQLRSERRTILLCTHNLIEAEMLADRIAIIRRGQIVAFDTPARLKRHLLGQPLLELTLAHGADGYLAGVADLVKVESWADNRIRYRTASPEATNPAVLSRLAGMGARVITLSEVSPSLEDVYLQIVGTSED